MTSRFIILLICLSCSPVFTNAQQPDNFILPIRLIAFSAVGNGNTYQLEWKTIDESDIESFIIEQSANGTDWEIAGNEPGTGNPRGSTHHFLLKNDKCFQCFYRLRITDKDGNYFFSKQIYAHSKPVQNIILVNNGTSKPQLFIREPEDDKIALQLLSSDGSILGNHYIQHKKGERLYNLPLASRVGLYLLIIRSKRFNTIYQVSI